jgi:predicted PurR-regulated permease PerM
MEAVYFTLVAIGLYFFSDWLLERIERLRGKRFEQRSIVFFAIIAVLALISFQVIQMLMRGVH